jgi:hypothetical protein
MIGSTASPVQPKKQKDAHPGHDPMVCGLPDPLVCLGCIFERDRGIGDWAVVLTEWEQLVERHPILKDPKQWGEQTPPPELSPRTIARDIATMRAHPELYGEVLADYVLCSPVALDSLLAAMLRRLNERLDAARAFAMTLHSAEGGRR